MNKALISTLIIFAFIGGSVFAAEKPSEKMQRKLKIIIPKVRLQNVTAEQALDYLRRISRDMDPEGEGVNIIYFRSKDSKPQKK
ncbi:MAG: hypothetical protein NE330_10420 [Lentisphaeraceae bacterium]|nr:hypothetical protein [Lentisphaeraceae bacterium]